MKKTFISSAVKSMSYDDEKRELIVSLTGNKSYKYFYVPRYLVEDFMNAKSAGKFYNAWIKNKYSSTKILPTPIGKRKFNLGNRVLIKVGTYSNKVGKILEITHYKNPSGSVRCDYLVELIDQPGCGNWYLSYQLDAE